MRKLIAVAGLVACVGTAQADEPYKWTGLYFGGHVGYGWGEWKGPLSYDDHDPGWPQPQYWFDDLSKSIEANNWLGGIQIGANYQAGSWLFGVEADVTWTSLEGEGLFLPYPNNPASPAWHIKSQLDLFGTVRGRLGWVNGPLLLYATGGLAWGNVTSTIEPVYTPYYVAAHGNAETTHVGYAVGGGLEWMLARNWTLKAEYLFIDLGEKDYAYVGKTDWGAAYDTDHHHADLQLHIVRLGVNYRLGGD